MKKLLSLLLSIMLLPSILSGCGEKTESQNNDLLTDSMVQGETMSVTENEATNQTVEGLQITLNGENEVTITMNDEVVGELDKSTDSNLRILLQGEGASEFECESEIYISSISWHLLHFTNKDTGENEIIVDGSSEGVFSETTCTFTINRVGICSYFDNIENYRIVFTDANKENLQTTVASGKLSDVLCSNSNQQQHILQAIFQNDETIKLKIYGDEAKTSFYNYEDIRLAIYESEEQINADNPCPSLEITVGAAIEDSGEGRAYAGVFLQDGSRTGHDLGEDSAYPEGRTLGTDYGVVMKYKNESIWEYVKPEYLYELYFGNDMIEVGKISDIFVEEEYTNIPPIPDTFPVSDKDINYFTPKTDDYIVTMVTYPTVAFFDYGFVRDSHGYPIYAPIDNHMSAVTIVRMISYDEFGIVDERSKTIYENETDAMTAFCDRLTDFDAGQLTLEETEDSPAIIELFDVYDKEGFASLILEEQYFGRFGMVRYFAGNHVIGTGMLDEGNVLLDKPTYDSEGFVTMQYPYEYELQDMSIGHSSILEDTGTLVQYASKPDTITLNYEEQRENYNTAPDNWKDHPYASYFPELPDSINVGYGWNATINEENLNLTTDSNGCTREQAENYIETFRNIEYENEIVNSRYEVNSNEELRLLRILEGDIFLGVFWRADEQSMTIYAFKQNAN